MLNIEAIPRELKALKQWVCWRYEQDATDATKKPTKVPYTPVTGRRASPIDPFHWATFTDAHNAYNAHKYDGIGFVLSKDDPYCVIDLDAARSPEETQLIYDTYAGATSFTEISPSGTGLHVWMKAQVPRGRKHHPIEIYSSARFITVTGNVQWNLPIEYRQEYADKIYAAMPPSASDVFTHYDGLDAPAGTDQEIVDRAYRAVNGAKFLDLWNGRWEVYYTSQSEADLALINIIAFYTQNAEQIIRLFRFSALGQRAKANSDYHVQRMIRLCFDRMPPKALIDQMRANVDAFIAKTLEHQVSEDIADNELFASSEVTAQPVQASTIISYENIPDDFDTPFELLPYEKMNFPEGIVGQVAYFLYQASPRPAREIALAGAIGFLAGMCGNAYNVSATGLNQYICAIASTGTGKDALGAPLDFLIRSVSALSPSAAKFYGSGNFASPQGLLRHLGEESRSMLGTVGECGLWLTTLSNPRLTDKNTLELRRALLDLYTKSGANGSYRGAVYSDKAKNIKPIRAPALTLLGDATAESFFESVSDSLIAEGFIPRWLLIEYKGKRPYLNELHSTFMPDSHMVRHIADMANYIHQMMESYQVVNVPFDDAALRESRKFNWFCDEQVRNLKAVALTQIWTRVHLKALRLAALFAVGRNYLSPCVEMTDWNSAVAIVMDDVNNMTRRFNCGDLQDKAVYEESKQQDDLRQAIMDYLHSRNDVLTSYGVTKIMQDNLVIPYVYFSRKLSRKASYKQDKRGAANAIRIALKEFVNQGTLSEVVDNQLKTTIGTSGACYIIADTSLLED